MGNNATNKLAEWRAGRSPLPKENLAWRLYGAGLESFGDDGRPTRMPMPEFGSDELLARVDALGVCFSDVKLINQGPNHPRVAGRDLVKEPVIPGHEVSLTTVGVGENLKNEYKIGDRFVVQADIYVNGVTVAYGYVLPGGLQQFGIIGKEILNGDDGCYLLPVKPETGYAEAALTEPWACVVACYRIYPRRAMKDGGVMLFIGPAAKERYTLPAGIRPRKVILAGVGDVLDKTAFGDAEIIEIGPISSDQLAALSEERTGDKGFDDIVVLGRTEPELIEALDRHAGKGAVINIVSDTPMTDPVTIDVGRAHYDRVLYVGGSDIPEGYEATTDSQFKPNGAAWFIGAAGPMGQMHVELSISMANGPKKILATDVDTNRLNSLKEKVASLAEKKGIKIEFLNPAEVGDSKVLQVASDMTGGRGFDDIIVLAPVPALIEQAVPHLAEGGKLNVFAGVPIGSMAKINLNPVYLKSARIIGSSGSSISDLEFTLSEAESGNLPTNRSVAAIGGIDAGHDGVKAVKDAVFPGKTVIFPQIAELPLVTLSDLQQVLPSVYSKLEDGKYWTLEAEEELLKLKLDL